MDSVNNKSVTQNNKLVTNIFTIQEDKQIN